MYVPIYIYIYIYTYIHIHIYIYIMYTRILPHALRAQLASVGRYETADSPLAAAIFKADIILCVVHDIIMYYMLHHSIVYYVTLYYDTPCMSNDMFSCIKALRTFGFQSQSPRIVICCFVWLG